MGPLGLSLLEEGGVGELMRNCLTYELKHSVFMYNSLMIHIIIMVYMNHNHDDYLTGCRILFITNLQVEQCSIRKFASTFQHV